MRTTNLLERQNQELKRRALVMGCFPMSCRDSGWRQHPVMETNQNWMEKLYLDMNEDVTTASHEAMASAAATKLRRLQIDTFNPPRLSCWQDYITKSRAL
jgi:hypothetical protein